MANTTKDETWATAMDKHPAPAMLACAAGTCLTFAMFGLLVPPVLYGAAVTLALYSIQIAIWRAVQPKESK